MKIDKLYITVVLFAISSFAASETLYQNIPYQQGLNGYDTFRIPAMVQTTNGTLLAFCEGRKNSSSDTGDIDIVLRRSFDGGNTWQPLQVVWSDSINTCGNPTAVFDQSNGRVWLFMTHNLGWDTQTEIIDGTSDGVRTIWSCYSDNNGASWSTPVNRFSEVQPPDTRWDATGPGNGIQLIYGSHAGRLIIPAIGRNIQSDNHGATWTQSGYLPSGSGEATIAELDYGTLMRNDRASSTYYKQFNRRVVSYSYNHGTSWTSLQVRDDLVCPICQASINTHNIPGASNDMLVFSNPAATTRIKMTVKISNSNGGTWEDQKLIYPADSAYSSLASMSDGNIGLLYENGDGWPYHRITFARFSPEWIKKKTIFEWNFEEFNFGTNLPLTAEAIEDTKGYGLNGTAEEGFAVVAGSQTHSGSSAVRFSGSGKGIRLTDYQSRGLLDFENSESFMVSVVFKTTDHSTGGSNSAGVLAAKDVSSGVPSWWLRVQDGKVRFFLDDGTLTASLYGSQTVSDGQWHRVVAARDAQDGKLYMVIDGKDAGTAVDETTGGFSNSNDVVIGCFNGGTKSFIGDIDKIAVIKGNISDILTVYDGDLNGDGSIDYEDLTILCLNWLAQD